MPNNKFWNGNKRTPEYTQALIYQLEQWREGRSIHSEFSNECCPDFSCCMPDMLMEENERIAYANRAIAELRCIQ